MTKTMLMNRLNVDGKLEMHVLHLNGYDCRLKLCLYTVVDQFNITMIKC